MEIKVLGTGCSSCNILYDTTKKAIEELSLEITLIKEDDIVKIMEYNVLKLPALLIDEKVVASGLKLSLAEVKDIITKAVNQ